MLKRLKQFLVDFYSLKKLIEDHFSIAAKAENQKRLIRNLLGTIDATQARDLPEMSQQQRKELVGRIESAYYDLKTIGRLLIIDSEEYMATQSDDLSFPRGSINGICLFLEKLDAYHAEHLENSKPDAPKDRYKMLPELLAENSRASSPFPSVTPTSE
jgi:hypothetical protein